MITVQRARELRAMIEKAAGAGLDDKDGSTAVELYPALTGGGALVKSGTRINWKGALKRAAVDLWDTAENTPEAAPSLWEDVLYKNGARIIPATITAGLAFSKVSAVIGATCFTSPCSITTYGLPRRIPTAGKRSPNERGGLHGRARRRNHSAAGVSLVGEA